MPNRKQPPQDEARSPQRQTREQYGSVKRPQDRNPERSDTARGSEPETRAAASRRG